MINCPGRTRENEGKKRDLSRVAKSGLFGITRVTQLIVIVCVGDCLYIYICIYVFVCVCDKQCGGRRLMSAAGGWRVDAFYILFVISHQLFQFIHKWDKFLLSFSLWFTGRCLCFVSISRGCANEICTFTDTWTKTAEKSIGLQSLESDCSSVLIFGIFFNFFSLPHCHSCDHYYLATVISRTGLAGPRVCLFDRPLLCSCSCLRL